jgi:hypothetical protein
LRGASALQKLLSEFPQDPLRAFVVWSPVLKTDIAPPGPDVLAQIADERAEQFWDPKRLVPDQVSAGAAVGIKAFRIFYRKRRTPYDLVAVYRPATRWEETIPAPIYCGNPVVSSIDKLRVTLKKMLRRR